MNRLTEPLLEAYLFTVLAAPLAQTSSPSVSVPSVAGRDDFAERGSVSRSRLKAAKALDLSKRLASRRAPAGHRPALLGLRLRRTGPYRRLVIGRTWSQAARIWTSTCKLKICGLHTGPPNASSRRSLQQILPGRCLSVWASEKFRLEHIFYRT